MQSEIIRLQENFNSSDQVLLGIFSVIVIEKNMLLYGDFG